MDDKVKSMFTNTDCIPMVNIFTKKKHPILKKKNKPKNKQEKNVNIVGDGYDFKS